jgi:hypothetical protein
MDQNRHVEAAIHQGCPGGVGQHCGRSAFHGLADVAAAVRRRTRQRGEQVAGLCVLTP